MKCDYQVSLLACTFASPCLGHEPKARVATQYMTSINLNVWIKNNQCAHVHVFCALKNNCIVNNIIFNNEMLFYSFHKMGQTTLVSIF
jgi:hypothetical protein